jgi:hypothetical protein
MKFYSLREYSVIVGVLPLVDDMAEIAIEPFGERYKPQPGNDGTITVIEDEGADNHYVSIKCAGSSPINAVMSALYNVQRRSAGGVAGAFPCAVKDRLGTSTLVSGAAMIVGWPARTMTKDNPGDVTWKIMVEQPERFEGGN